MKTLVRTAVALLVLAQACAAATYKLSVTADRKDAIYRRGETVTFTLSLTCDGQPVDGAPVAWVLNKDGVPPETTGTAKLAGGTAQVSGHLDEPGFLHCRASFTDPAKSNHVERGGAAVDPLEIRPGLPPPADFDAFWAAKKRELAAVPAEATLTPVPWADKAVECFDAQVKCLGAPVSGYLARPVAAQPKSLPAILLVHGAGVRSAVLANAAAWAAKGLLAFDINAHGLPNGKPEPFYKDLADGEYKDYRTRGRESTETIHFVGMFVRLVRAMDFLAAQPGWDGRTLVVHGSSQGGYQSIVAAGLDPRVTFYAGGVPAGCDHCGFKAGRINGWPKFIATGETPPDNVVAAVRYVDAANFATRAKCPGILTVGFIDTTCPPSSVYAAYNVLPGRKSIYTDIPCGHRMSKESAAAMNEAIGAYLAAAKAGRP